MIERTRTPRTNPPAAATATTAAAGPRVVVALVVLLLALVTVAHYLTPPELSARHELYRRLYYLPIVWAAFVFGWRGGLATAFAATLAYVPHAFLMTHHRDPSSRFDKALEIVLFFVFAALLGVLVERERRARALAIEQALARAQAEAATERLKAIVQLSRGLAHEIRNPLGGIQGAIEILASALPPDAKQSQLAAVGLREVARLDRVLGDFLAYARPRPPRIACFPCRTLIDDVVTLLVGQASAAGVELQSGADGMGEELSGDRDQLVQVLLNLGRNAIEATPPGGTVRICCEATPTSACLVVCDTGRGVPPELAQSIFEPYVTGRESGTGLGLAIARSLVDGHHGTLRHAPAAGGGTCFTVALPRQPPTET
ncbi:MAG: hypothetical protein H6747_14400 [Deltaproteobacteria bacterium]|nr:hypothetical protein [Deltaproteobacteria bacterium]